MLTTANGSEQRAGPPPQGVDDGYGNTLQQNAGLISAWRQRKGVEASS